MPARSRGLGKGLEAILGPGARADAGEHIQTIAIEKIRPNPHQPRKQFDETALAELAASIKQHGIVQPVIVTQEGDRYTLVAGERRWRAARLAGLAAIPAIVRSLDAQALTEIALIENLQREDLSPIEEAHAYQALQEEFNLTQAEIAERVGKSRSQIANTLRLLLLHPEVQALVASGELSMGHAKLLLSLASMEDQRRFARQAVEHGWTVRALQARIAPKTSAKRKVKPEPPAASAVGARRLDADWRAAAAALQASLGAPVTLSRHARGDGGRIIVEFFNQADFERLFQRLTGEAAATSDGDDA